GGRGRERVAGDFRGAPPEAGRGAARRAAAGHRRHHCGEVADCVAARTGRGACVDAGGRGLRSPPQRLWGRGLHREDRPVRGQPSGTPRIVNDWLRRTIHGGVLVVVAIVWIADLTISHLTVANPLGIPDWVFKASYVLPGTAFAITGLIAWSL